MLEEERAQVSLELFIVLAAIIGIVMVIVTQLQTTANAGTKTVNHAQEALDDRIRDMLNEKGTPPDIGYD